MEKIPLHLIRKRKSQIPTNSGRCLSRNASVKTNLTRLCGRSLCGKRLEMDAPFGAWGTQTFIAGLTQDELIAPWVIKGAMDGEAFEAYVRNVLVPELQPGTVVICDNLATHYNKTAAAILREAGCWF